MSTRRYFLSTLGKLLGAGGVLLPVAGKGALALPADLGNAAALPVAPTPLPASPEMLRLREIRRELHEIYLWGPQDFPKPVDRQKAWADGTHPGKAALCAGEVYRRVAPTDHGWR